MSHIAIDVTGLGKSYRIGHRNVPERYTTLRDMLSMRARTWARRTRDLIDGKLLVEGESEEFWALKDVSLRVEAGERVGIIGRNGAGKSTLLKLLSRITEPSRGRITLNGRVASLLEVGTGFHPELTGRENVFLNGAILGMSRQEIKKKFDEIVAFSEVEQFLDTPVKRYSTGMHVRLAFAVAAHLDPEILIVDEVLAVGDAAFQKKCLGKLTQVSRTDGRTILFVSHNIAAVEALCNKAILLDRGRCVFSGTASDGIDAYRRADRNAQSVDLKSRTDREGDQKAKFIGIRIIDEAGEETTSIRMGSSFFVEATVQGKLRDAIVGVIVGNDLREQLIRGYTYESCGDVIDFNGIHRIRCEFKNFPLMHGAYEIHLWLGRRGELADYVRSATGLVVCAADVFGTGRNPDPSGGIAFTDIGWQVQDLGKST